jgi:hypothetical protein
MKHLTLHPCLHDDWRTVLAESESEVVILESDRFRCVIWKRRVLSSAWRLTAEEIAELRREEETLEQ